MRTESNKIIKLSDYRAPHFKIATINLRFDLSPHETIVTNTMQILRNGDHSEPLVLDGEDMELLEIKRDGQALQANEYEITKESLTLNPPPNTPDEFTLEITTRIDPANNTRLEGLYLSSGIYCTQCEAQGFRRMSYFLDRPDVMATYDVTISAPKEFSAILSNGNLVSDETVGDRRICHWHDPYPKPCYLFALVAGDLAKVSDKFTTASGRQVALNIYLKAGYESRAAYAMKALKRAMRWDEERFGLEYDLDLFNIVAIDDFNMGAMENKSLNVFNAKYVLADEKTATDSDYMFIESIIGHEYFHNWSGNRVTCRDWFQLSLKEGLTVFRDQEFSGDQNSKSHTRILDVIRLKDSQFPEDAGKLSHPVRPAEYVEINNFYTATVYEKGAELVRMMQSILGVQGFKKGLSLYFSRHDGQAVTCDDFLACMRDANEAALAGFEIWYSQSGTPRVTYQEAYDSHAKTYHVTLRQVTKPTADSKHKQPVPIPLEFALLDSKGNKMPVTNDNILQPDGRQLLLLDKEICEYTFTGIGERPHLSLNRNFTAPIIIDTPQSEADMAFHMTYDDDAYLRWEAVQNYNMLILGNLIEDENYDVIGNHAGYFDALTGIIQTAHEDAATAALLLNLPSEASVADSRDKVDVTAIHQARKKLKSLLAEQFADEFTALYDALKITDKFKPNLQQIGKRALRSLALSYCDVAGSRDAESHYFSADNMTDKIAAMQILADKNKSERQAVFDDFYGEFKNDAIVLDKWFSLQARSHADDAHENIKLLAASDDFNIKNPNRLRSLVGSFAFGNNLKFNCEEGYDFVLDILGAVDQLNPQTCARLLGAFTICDKLPEALRTHAKARLRGFRDGRELSKDSGEIIAKLLDGEAK